MVICYNFIDMAFELKILGTTICPRCNATAELRIDQVKRNSDWILVYVVCKTCRLNRYSHTISKKDFRLLPQLRRLHKIQIRGNVNPKTIDKINELEKRLGIERRVDV